MLSLASRLTSASTTYQGETSVSVRSNISSLARENSTHRSRVARSLAENFQRRSGSSTRDRNRRSCSSSLTENQYLRSRMPSSMSICSNAGHCRRNSSTSSGEQ